MLDLTKTFDWLKDQAVIAAGPTFKEFDPTKAHIWRKPDGTPQIIDPKPLWRKHKALDLQTVIDFALRFKNGKTVPAIWYNRQAVICLLDDETRRERVEFALSYSPQSLKLSELEKQPTMSQRDLIFLLRTIFKNCMGQVPNIVEILRSVRWGTQKEGGAEVQRGKSSIGQTLKAELESTKGTIPEYVTLSVPIFNNGSLAFVFNAVECVLEPIEETQSFKLFPVPGALEMAITNGEAIIANTIREGLGKTAEAIPVYYGCP